MVNHAQNIARQAESTDQNAFLADRTLVPQTIFDTIGPDGPRGHRVVRMATAQITALNAQLTTLNATATNLRTTNVNLRTTNANLTSANATLQNLLTARVARNNAVGMALKSIAMYIPKKYKFMYNCEDVAYPNGDQYVGVGGIDGNFPFASQVPKDPQYVPVQQRGKGYGLPTFMRDAKALGEYVRDLRRAKGELVAHLQTILPSLSGEAKTKTETLLAEIAAKFNAEEEAMATEEYVLSTVSDHGSDEEDDDEEGAAA